nr:MAG TPA: hypothetical protein [Caudoviricetes sp.]
MSHTITADFSGGANPAIDKAAWQYDYGASLAIKGLDLPATVEVHFSTAEYGGTAETRVGTTADGITTVAIPDRLMEMPGRQDYRIYAYIYLTDVDSGHTEYKICIRVRARPKPGEARPDEDKDHPFSDIVQVIGRLGKEKLDTPVSPVEGQFLRVKAVNADGTIVLETAEVGGEPSKPKTWAEIRKLCRNNKIRGLLDIGETFSFTRDGEKLNAVVVDFIENGQHSSGLKLRGGLQTGVIFQMEKVLANLQYDAREAFYCAENGLEPGTYHFTVDEQPWYKNAVGKTYQFTITKAVPAGGQIVWNHAANTTFAGADIDTFADGASAEPVESTTIKEGSGGTALGSIKSAFSGGFNSVQRTFYGNNRYKESAVRQFLSSEAEAGNVWMPQNKWDRPPAWANTQKGFLNGIDEDLLESIAVVDRHVYQNTISDGGTNDEIQEKIFLPSRGEIYAPAEDADDISAFVFFEEKSASANPNTNADPCRIKNTMAGSAGNWWLESPVVNSTYLTRLITQTGSVGNNTASSSYGVVPAFVIA